MTRLLVPTRTGLAAGQDDDRGFLSRLGKFIPSESGTLFTVVNAYLAEELGPKGNGQALPPFLGVTYFWWAIVVLIVCFVANIVLLDRMFDTQFAGDPLKSTLKKKHIFASSCGFVIWAYAIKSPVFAQWYKSFAAFLLIGVFLIIVNQVKPPLDSPPR